MSESDRTYNAGELSNLIDAKDVDMQNTENSWAQIQNAWETMAPADAGAWATDWAAVKDRYAPEHDRSARYVALLSDLPMSLSDYDATTEYQSLLKALNPNWPGNWGAGSYQDVTARLRDAYASLNQAPPQGQPIPQGDPSYDSGVSPNSWQAYVTGAAVKLGILNATDVPPGTPGTDGAPPLIPTWVKVVGVGALALFGINEVIGLKKAL